MEWDQRGLGEIIPTTGVCVFIHHFPNKPVEN